MLSKLSSSQQILLQWAALIMMTLDHYALMFHDGNHLFHTLSRFVFPVFAYLMAYNYLYRTSNKFKYLRRILLWAFISQPIYAWSLDFEFYKLNILFTLFFGLFFVHCVEYLNQKSINYYKFYYGTLFSIFIVIGFFVSYYWFGLILLTTFVIYFKNPTARSLVFVAINIIMLNIMFGDHVQSFCGLLFFGVVVVANKASNIVLIPRLPGFVFYVFYPVHLLVLGQF